MGAAAEIDAGRRFGLSVLSLVFLVATNFFLVVTVVRLDNDVRGARTAIDALRAADRDLRAGLSLRGAVAAAAVDAAAPEFAPAAAPALAAPGVVSAAAPPALAAEVPVRLDPATGRPRGFYGDERATAAFKQLLEEDVDPDVADPERITQDEAAGLFAAQLAYQPRDVPPWYHACAHQGSRSRRGNEVFRGLGGDQEVHIVKCLAESRVAARDFSPLRLVQIGANTGLDSFRRGIIHLRKYYPELPVEAVLVEPVPYVFETLKKAYASPEVAGAKISLVLGAVSAECMAAGTTRIYHPRLSLLQEWEAEARATKPHAFSTRDGSWKQKWLYELASLDPEQLKRNFGKPGQMESTEIRCLSVASLVDEALGGRVDYAMVDVEGFEYDVLRTFDVARKPRLISYEHKVMYFQRPAAAWRANSWCIDNGYYLEAPGLAERVCVLP